jgi:hypothetical protein
MKSDDDKLHAQQMFESIQTKQEIYFKWANKRKHKL